ncbi:MAG: hypothetical protein N3B18_04505 [Desulfobacterota bacterium]|nr:hypothetical protein [Thermodesulfobacteriota bacterium]
MRTTLLEKIKKGKLEKLLASKRQINMPKTENIQTIEVTCLPDGGIAEGDEYILQEKEKKLEALRAQYGDIDESQITWVFVKKKGSHQSACADRDLRQRGP